MTNIGDTSATTSLMAFLHFLGIQTSTALNYNPFRVLESRCPIRSPGIKLDPCIRGSHFTKHMTATMTTEVGFLHSLGAIVLRQSRRRDSEASQDTGSKQQGYMTLTISASLHRKTRRMRISAGGWLKD